MPEFPVSVIFSAVNNTKTALNEVKGDVEEMSKGFSGLENVVQGALGALSAYAGTKGLMGMVNASVEANRMLVRSRFYLKGMGGDVESNISTLRKWGSEIQRDIGINDEFAVLVASRLAPRFKDLNKIQAYATTLLKGHRIGVLDAESASIMLMRAAEGNSRAMLWLAYNLGITVFEFESMDSIMAKIQSRLEGLTEQLLPFDMAMARLKESFSDFLEEAGTPVANAFATLLNAILDLMKRFPLLGKIIKGVMVVISGALAGLGFGLALQTILKFIGVTTTALVPWGLVVGAIIFGVIFYLDKLRNVSEETAEKMKLAMFILGGIMMTVFLFIQSAFFIPFMLALDVLLIATQMKIEGYELSWEGFKQFWEDTWMGIYLWLVEIWAKIKKWIDDTKKAWDEYWTGIWLMIEEIWNKISGFIGEKVGWINSQVQNLIDWARRAKEAILNIPSQIGGFVGGLLSFQKGGYIPETGPYFLHRGEYVVPASKGGGISLTITGNTFLDEESAVRMGDLIIKVLQRQVRI